VRCGFFAFALTVFFLPLELFVGVLVVDPMLSGKPLEFFPGSTLIA